MVAGGSGLGIELNTAHMRIVWGVGYSIMKSEEWGTGYTENKKELRGTPDAEINFQWHFKP